MTKAEKLPPLWQRFDKRTKLVRWSSWLIVVVVTLVSWRWISEHTLWQFTIDAHEKAYDLADRMFPPNWQHMPKLWYPLWETINIATMGTLLAIVAACPIAFLAASNLNPFRALRWLALLTIVTSRSINSLIWALLFVSILGPGTLAGILAIAMRSIGFIAKLLYEAIEEIDPSQVEAIRATGASEPQVVTYGFLPQIMPAFAGISLLRWDINIRESTVLGLVGAGGIGLQIDAAVNVLRWQDASMIFFCILIIVLISEFVSDRLRRRLI
jgi:phosphonate transport system permease protein